MSILHSPYASSRLSISFLFFFFNDTATTEIYTLSLHDALPISCGARCGTRAGPVSASREVHSAALVFRTLHRAGRRLDRKSTRLNSSHPSISYAVFCLKKKKKKKKKLKDKKYN